MGNTQQKKPNIIVGIRKITIDVNDTRTVADAKWMRTPLIQITILRGSTINTQNNNYHVCTTCILDAKNVTSRYTEQGLSKA